MRREKKEILKYVNIGMKKETLKAKLVAVFVVFCKFKM